MADYSVQAGRGVDTREGLTAREAWALFWRRVRHGVDCALLKTGQGTVVASRPGALWRVNSEAVYLVSMDEWLDARKDEWRRRRSGADTLWRSGWCVYLYREQRIIEGAPEVESVTEAPLQLDYDKEVAL